VTASEFGEKGAVISESFLVRAGRKIPEQICRPGNVRDIRRPSTIPALAHSLPTKEPLWRLVRRSGRHSRIPADGGRVIGSEVGGDSCCLTIEKVVEHEFAYEHGGGFAVIVIDGAVLLADLDRNVVGARYAPHDRIHPASTR
jgi:hypothetical protein